MLAKVALLAAVIGLVLGAATLSASTPKTSKASTEIPSIRACTRAELGTVLEAFNTIDQDVDALNQAVDTDGTQGMYDGVIVMHANWFETSPDLPYCAQAVHFRLLMDRLIEIMTLAGVSSYYGDDALAQMYFDMIDPTLNDLIRYGSMLAEYRRDAP